MLTEIAETMDHYIKKILTARVYDVSRETPLESVPNLSARTGNRVMLKREDMQSVFSFKCRGAYNRIFKLKESHPKTCLLYTSPSPRDS